jgi:hypothetical protein
MKNRNVRFILSVSDRFIKQQIYELYVIDFCIIYSELHLLFDVCDSVHLGNIYV